MQGFKAQFAKQAEKKALESRDLEEELEDYYAKRSEKVKQLIRRQSFFLADSLAPQWLRSDANTLSLRWAPNAP